MSDLDLCYMPATEALKNFKSRKLSPVELMKALIARAEKVDPKVKAFGHRFFDRALDQAKKAEAKYAKTGARLRPLEGLAVAIKDETAIKGEVTEYGSLLFKGHVDEETGPPAERILGAGAILLARSTAPEFSCAGITHSKLWGATATPWNLKLTSGGSSGGAGSSLASGMTTLANGSDIGGSIRIPAAACGVYGFKPPYGRIPDSTPFNLDWYCHAGPMARTVEDCALLENVMVGPHPRDIVAIRPALKIPTRIDQGVKGWKIAVSYDLGFFDVEKDMIAGAKAAADKFRQLGAQVDEVEIGWDARVRTAANSHLAGLFGVFIASYKKKDWPKMMPYARAIAKLGQQTRMKDFLKAMEIEGWMFEKLGALFEKYDLLICPTLASSAIAKDRDLTKPLKVGKRKIDGFLDWCMTYPFNAMSRCPVMAAPAGFCRNGFPASVQLVGKPYDDVTVFKAAKALESLTPLYDSAARRPKL
jgi:Asp-tRNA(Asn)/Glu-tRNA(Gln) amidotransferase A subunit family amidase